MPYTPNQRKYLTVSQVRTNDGQKDVKIILDVDTNVFYTLDDDNNFTPIAYSQASGIFTDIDVTNIATINNLYGNIITGSTISATTINGVQANLVSYNNTSSGLSATTVQSAIDELDNYEFYNSSVVGLFHNFAVTNVGLINQVIQVNQLGVHPIHLKKNVTITEMNIFIGVGVSGSSVFGLYDSLSGAPNNLLFDNSSAPFNNAVATSQTYTLTSPITLKPGVYYVGWNSNSAANFRSFTWTLLPAILGVGNANSVNTPVLYKALTYTGSLPANWLAFNVPITGVAVGNNVPHTVFKIA